MTCFADLVAAAERAPLAPGLVPPPRFAGASFESYRPDPAFPSQAAAVARLRRRPPPWGRRALYLDGPFGVGKTHLLAAAYRAGPEPRAFLTFPDLVLTLIQRGVDSATADFRRHRLLCVDEFELDDPASLVLVLRFLRRLSSWPARTRVVATSTTQPDRLGTGRLDAERFRGEIAELARLFEIVPIDGRDRRAVAPSPPRQRAGAVVEVDHPTLAGALAAVHPLRYAALAAQISCLVVRSLRPVPAEQDALRLVHFVDTLYDLDVPLAAPDAYPVDALFAGPYADGPFAAKYARCRSRLRELLA